MRWPRAVAARRTGRCHLASPPWIGVTIGCGILLLGEAAVFLWPQWRVGEPQSWRRGRVLLPAALSALALGVAALEWQAMHVLSDVQPDAWHLAYQQRDPGDWFDQMSVAFLSSQMCTELIMLATVVALVFGALGTLDRWRVNPCRSLTRQGYQWKSAADRIESYPTVDEMSLPTGAEITMSP